MASSSGDPPPDAGNASSKNAWSQIVRIPPTKKPSQVPDADQIQTLTKEPQARQARDQVQMMAEAGSILSKSTLDNEVPRLTDARVFDEASLRGEEIIDGSKTAIDGNLVTADASEVAQNKSLESSHGDAGDARVSRPPWRKPSVATQGDMNPQPVMGATAWPALTEALNIKKHSDNRKIKESPHKSSQNTSIQESLSKVSLHSGDGSNYGQGVKSKPSFKGASAGVGRPAFQPIENGASFSDHLQLGAHGSSEQPLKHYTHARMKGNFSASPSMDTDRVYHHRNDGAGSFHNNNRKWRNNHREQARGWHHYGRSYENAGDMALLLHEQRIGPRNMPRPFLNMNPGFYSMPHFQNNGMYCMPPGAQEFVPGPPYYPVAPPRGVMAPDPFRLRSMIINQVDYYFSVENLCRDVFLRTHMDEEGFVPVSVIAQFNRIQKLSNNEMVVLEALQHSAVVEVQHDKVRRRNDRGKWRLMQDQVYAVNSAQKNAAVGHGFQGQSERSHYGGLISSEDTKFDSALERTALGAGHACSSCDRLNDMGDCKASENREHQNVVDINSSGMNGSIEFFCRGNIKEEDAVSCVVMSKDSGKCQVFESPNLQEGPVCSHRMLLAASQETCSSHSGFLEGKARVLQATMDGNCAPEGFWMENVPYLGHGRLEKNDMQAKESEFMLKSHRDDNEHPEEGSDRELDRPIKVSHKSLGSLGSYIAVP